MVPSEVEKTIAEHDEKLVRMMEHAHASSLVQLDAIKLRMSHHEKLVGLCAGTLALSFTAATAFHAQHTPQVVTSESLFHAWQFLLSAIALGIVANSLSVNGIANLGNSLGKRQVDVYFSLLKRVLSRLAPDYAKSEQEASDKELRKAERSGRLGNFLVRVGALIGVLAQIAAFCAFVSLYNFAKIVLLG
jgi:hypothetical protein